MIIDGSNLIMGRVATLAAKKALYGEKIDIVNCREMYITGKRRFLLFNYHRKRKMGTPAKGPFMSRMPDRFVRRAVKRMLPYKKPRGREAFERIMCYAGVPEKLKGQKMITLAEANIKKIPNTQYMKVGEICRLLGGKK